MTIEPNQPLPAATFRIMSETGPAETTTDAVFSGKSVVLFAVPGAYTPTCHGLHLPGFLALADQFKARGVDTVACTAVNDIFVLDAWAAASGAKDSVLFLADGNGDFAKALGLDLDGSAIGFGIRSKRYAMFAVDGVVKILNVEENPSQAEASAAEHLLADIDALRQTA